MNLLFLMTDQNRVDTLGCYGNPHVEAWCRWCGANIRGGPPSCSPSSTATTSRIRSG